MEPKKSKLPRYTPMKAASSSRGLEPHRPHAMISEAEWLRSILPPLKNTCPSHVQPLNLLNCRAFLLKDLKCPKIQFLESGDTDTYKKSSMTLNSKASKLRKPLTDVVHLRDKERPGPVGLVFPTEPAAPGAFRPHPGSSFE